MKLLLPILFILVLPACGPSGPETDLMQLDVPVQLKKVTLAECPPEVGKLVFKEVPEDVDGKTLRGEAVIYELDTDANGIAEYVMLLFSPNGVRHFMLVEDGKVVARDYWFEVSQSDFRIVSLVKAGEYEILFKRPVGGRENYESSAIFLWKKQGDAVKEVFNGETFRHEWAIGKPEKYIGTFYAAKGNEPPRYLLQYEGALTVDFMKLPKYRPNFVIKKTGRLLKVYRWDEAKFKFAEK